MDTSLQVAFAVPILTGLIALITARVGISGRLKEMEYYDKRLTILTAILGSHKNTLASSEIVSMENEIKVIVRKMSSSQTNLERDQIKQWENQVWWKRYITLPPSESIGESIAKVIYYVYLVAGIGYIVTVPFLLYGLDVDFPLEAAFTGSFTCFAMCYGIRLWLLRKRRKSNNKVEEIG